MGLIEAILAGLQFERLQRPLIFFSMLIGFLFFSLAGIAILYGAFEVLVSDNEGKADILAPMLGMVAFSVIFFGLAAICGHFIKKCIK